MWSFPKSPVYRGDLERWNTWWTVDCHFSYQSCSKELTWCDPFQNPPGSETRIQQFHLLDGGNLQQIERWLALRQSGNGKLCRRRPSGWKKKWPVSDQKPHDRCPIRPICKSCHKLHWPKKAEPMANPEKETNRKTNNKKQETTQANKNTNKTTKGIKCHRIVWGGGSARNHDCRSTHQPHRRRNA